MKKKIVSGILITIVLVLIFRGIFTPFFGFFFAIMAACACYEVMHAAGIANVELIFLAVAFSFVMPLMIEYGFRVPLIICVMIYIMALLMIWLSNNEELKFEQITITIYSSVVIPFAFSTIILISDLYLMYKDVSREQCIYLVWFAASCAMFTDVFAYFVGTLMGKHPLAPTISPKKTIEGAVGGVVLELLFNLLTLYLFRHFFANIELMVPIWVFLILSVFLSLIGICGDLIASLIKRNYGKKDFSNLIPAHGGIMDRFDSVIFVAPMLYTIFTVYKIM